MSTEAESPPPRGGTAILWPGGAGTMHRSEMTTVPASALAQTAVIGAGAAVAAGIAAFFIPRAAEPAAAAAAGARAHRRGDGGTGRASRLMTGGVTDVSSAPDAPKPDRRPGPGRPR
jgi:hypothetical protein